MSDSIPKGVGEQLGDLGKQIVQEVTHLPAKLTGFEVDEKKGQGQGGNQRGSVQSSKSGRKQQKFNPIELLKKQDEVKTQKELAYTRQFLKEMMQPKQEVSDQVKMQMAEMEIEKQEIKEEKTKAQKVLKQPTTKAKRGNLFGIKAKQFGGETGKNVKSQ